MMAGGKELVDLEAEIARLGKGGWRRREGAKILAFVLCAAWPIFGCRKSERCSKADARRGTAV